MIGVAPPAYDPAAPRAAHDPAGRLARDRTRATWASCSGGTAAPSPLLVAVNTVAVIASMVGPYLLGGLVEDLSTGRRDLHLGRTVALFAVALVVQAVFVRLVRLRGAMLGERMLADLREDFLVRSVGLPPGVLERAGTGDLLSRITTDIDRLANAMREAVPQLAIGVVWAALLLGALAVTAPPLALAVLVAAAAAAGRLPLVLPARPVAPTARRPPGTRRWPRRSPRPSTPDAPSRRTGWATRRDRAVRTADQAVDGLGALHAVAAHRCSSR